jgi:hypothetical protein
MSRTQYAACPNCQGTEAEKVSFTWWGGWMGPKLFNLVKCRNCGTTYNGKTGRSSTSAIAVYAVVVAFVAFAGTCLFLVAMSSF